MKILSLLTVLLASLFALEIGATDYWKKYPSLMRIKNQSPNVPDEDSPLMGISMENSEEEFCISACQDTNCSVLSYQTPTKKCYLSTKDPHILNRGLFYTDGAISFINTKHIRSLNYYMLMPYTPPWTDQPNPPQQVTMDECAQMCNAKENGCYSFSYTPINQTCYMYNKSMLLSRGRNAQPKILSPSRVYFEKQAAFLSDFYHLFEFRLKGNPIPVQTHSECVQKCLNDTTCKSFSMTVNLDNTNKLNCRLSNSRYNTNTNNLIADPSSMYFYMKVVVAPGGTSIYAFRPQGAITSNNFPNSYPVVGAADTTAVIVAPKGTLLTATLTRLNLRMARRSTTRSLDTLTINGIQKRKSDVGKIITADENNTITVNFQLGRGASRPSRQGFFYRLQYHWDWLCHSSSLTLKGLDDQPQMLANPGFPNNPQIQSTCQWTIKSTTQTSGIYLSFTKIPAGKGTLMIEGTDGNTIKDGNFVNGYFGDTVVVSYTPAANNDDSFQLYYVQTATPTSNVSNVVQEIKIGKSDTKTIYFNRTLNLTETEAANSIIELRYKVIIEDFVPFDSYTNIIIESLNFGRKWFSECYDGFIWAGIVGNSTSATAAYRSCGVSQTSQIIKYPGYFGFIDIRTTLIQRRDANDNFLLKENERSGFRIKIKTGIPVIKENEVPVIGAQSLQPDMDDELLYYKPNQDKYWTILSQDTKVPRVEIKNIALGMMPQTEICDNDRLYITPELRAGTPDITYEICGDNTLLPKPTLYFPYKDLNIHVKFLADDRHTSTGFVVNVDYVNVYNGASGNTPQEVSEPGYLVSSLYPKLISGRTVSWKITSVTYNRVRVSFDFATFDESCKLIRLHLPGGGVVSECVEAFSDPLEFVTGTVLTWIAPYNMPNRLAANVTYFQKVNDVIVKPKSGGDGYVRIDNQMLNLPSAESGSQGVSIKNVEESVCLKWCSSMKSRLCMAVMYNDNKKTCYISTSDDWNVMSKGLISDKSTTTYLVKENYPNMQFFVFMPFIPPFPIKATQYKTKIEECAYLCNWINDKCQSFVYASLTGTCHTYHESSLGYRGDVSSTQMARKPNNPSYVYFEKQFGSLYYFNHISGYYIPSKDGNGKFAGTAEECAQRCLRSTDCKSFSFNLGLNPNCNMSIQHYNSSDFYGLSKNASSVYFYMKTSKTENVLRRQGEITGPKFPNSFPVGSVDISTVTAPQGTRFTANITRLNLRRSSNDGRKCSDVLVINGRTYCDEQVPFEIKLITNGSSLEPQLSVELASLPAGTPLADSMSYNYRIEYMWDWVCKPNPGVNLRASSTPQRLASPGFPGQMTANGRCQWTIQALPDSHVYLSFVKLPFVGGFSVLGENNNVELKSGDFGNRVTITYQRGRNNSYDTFELYYLITDGEANNYKVSQYTSNVTMNASAYEVIAIPVVTSNISASIIDVWYTVNILSSIPNTVTTIAFEKLGFGKAEWFDECYDGFISIGDSYNLISSLITLKRICGTSLRGTSMHLNNSISKIVIWGRLYNRRIGQTQIYTLNPAERAGFEIVIIPGIYETTDSQTRTIQNSTTFSPNLGDDNKYLSDQNDIWEVKTKDLGAMVTLQSIDLATIPDHPEICDNDRLRVYPDATQRRGVSICGRNNNSLPTLYFATPGSSLRVQFWSDDRHSARGFNASVLYTTIYPMDTEAQVVKKPGFLISTNYPKILTNAEGSWVIHSDSFTHFRLKIYNASANEFCKHITLSFAGGSHSKCASADEGAEAVKVGTRVTWRSGDRPNRFAAEVIYVNAGSNPSLKLPGGAIAGIVIGILLLVAVAAGLAYFFIQRRNQPSGTGVDAVIFNRGYDDTRIVNQEMSESKGATISTA